MLRHQAIASQRVVVFPARQGAHPPDGGIHHLQPGAVALPPDHAFMVGRRDLAPLEHQFAAGIENQLGIVERAAIAFVHPQDDHDAAQTRALADGTGDLPRHHDGLFIQLEMGGSRADRRGNKREVGVVGNKRLRKNDDLRPLLRSLVDCLQNPGQRPAGLMKVRCNLGCRRTNNA